MSSLEIIILNTEPKFGMGDDGNVSSEWDFSKDQFLGESKNVGLVSNKGKLFNIETNLRDFKSKLLKLQIIN